MNSNKKQEKLRLNARATIIGTLITALAVMILDSFAAGIMVMLSEPNADFTKCEYRIQPFGDTNTTYYTDNIEVTPTESPNATITFFDERTQSVISLDHYVIFAENYEADGDSNI